MMKKVFLKTVAILMTILIIQLQTIAGSSMSISSEDEEIVNFDESEIYNSFDQVNDLISYVSANDAVTYSDIAVTNNKLIENISSTAALALNTPNNGEPPIIGAFWWGCILSWAGILIVYFSTDNNKEYVKQAVSGCLVSGGVEVISYVVLFVVYYLYLMSY
jgi:hypothetical protein